MKELQSVLKDITKILSSLKENEQIKGYCLIGAMAIGSRGSPRATKDIDFLIDTDENYFQEKFSQKFKKGRYSIKVFRGDIDDPIRSLIKIFDEKGNPLVDLIPIYWEWQKNIIDSAELIQLEQGVVVPIAKAEDLIIFKLKAGGLRDLLDAEELVKITLMSKKLDKSDILNLAKKAWVDKKLKHLFTKFKVDLSHE